MTRLATGTSDWTVSGRCTVFLLAATSLACLLSEFYGICSMRVFTARIFGPAMVALAVLVVFDLSFREGNLGRAVLIGALAGFASAIAYDIFRLPFVFARQWHIASVVPPLNLFKVFPAFGAMILGQPTQQAAYSTTATLVGWAYHFSNGATIGVMYVALIGNARRRHWSWAVLLAVGLELGMLFTPYPRVFQIAVTAWFVAVTLAAHGVFGIGLGLTAKQFSERGIFQQKADAR